MLNIHQSRTLLITTFILMFIMTYAQDTLEGKTIKELTSSIIKDDNPDQKLIHNNQLIHTLNNILGEFPKELISIDSNGLIIELISEDQKLQLLTWAVEFNDQWEYFSFLKSYNEQKDIYQVHELIPTPFPIDPLNKENYHQENWPAAVYYKIIETEYNNRKYYSLFGWIANEDQTSYKIIEVMSLNKSGKPYFGKSKYFSKEKSYYSRMVFAYSSQSKFQLDYGEYLYSTKKWNAKKRRYDQIDHEEMLIVYDHLIPLYPDLKNLGEFMVPVGNSVDAFYFDKGKWRYISDIDARNIRRKEEERTKPGMNLFDNNE